MSKKSELEYGFVVELEGKQLARGEVSMVAMKVGSQFASYDMRVAQIDQNDGSVMPFKAEEAVMVPLRAVSEGLNGTFAMKGEKVSASINGVSFEVTIGEAGTVIEKGNVFVPLQLFTDCWGLFTSYYTYEPHFEDVFVISKLDLSVYPKPQTIMAIECLMARIKNLRKYVSMEVPKAIFDLANPLPVTDPPEKDQLTIGGLNPVYSNKYVDLYPFPEEARKKEGIPVGTITHYHMADCKMYPGTEHDIDVYVPSQYDGKTPAKLLIMTDGPWYLSNDGYGIDVPTILDNMIHEGRLPVVIGLFISFSSMGTGNPTYGYSKGWFPDNRSTEYDSVDERYANFVVDEVMPLTLKGLNISDNNLDRAIYGSSSGGPGALGVAWHRNEAVGSVFSAIGSFANIRGALLWPYALRREKRNIRIFYLSGKRDAHLIFGNWYNIGREMVNSLEYSGYEYVYAVGKPGHNTEWVNSLFPQVFEWLFTGKPFQHEHVEVLDGKIDESL